jgi:hypothetical protein
LDQIKPGYLQLSYIMAFKAACVFPLILLWLWAGRRPLAAGILAFSTAAILLSSLLVLDLSRAACFCFPAVTLGILALWDYDRKFCKHALAICLLINLITPFYQAMTKGLWMINYPLVVELAPLLF